MSLSRACFLIFALSACSPREEALVFAAASMGPTLEALRGPFEQTHPGTVVHVELSSSRLACAKVSDQGRAADLVISADENVLRELLLPTHAMSVTRFATNRLVVAAVRDSDIAKRLTTTPWQRVLADPAVRIGIADPAQAPVGARALDALRLNDEVSDDPELRLGAAIRERLTPRFTWPDVSKLIAPLETGELDVAFVYESEARQYNFAFAPLDARIDGSATTFYAASVPRNARQPSLGVALLAYLFSDAGRAIAKDKYLTLLDKPVTGP